jgi:hypothetical protein
VSGSEELLALVTARVVCLSIDFGSDQVCCGKLSER